MLSHMVPGRAGSYVVVACLPSQRASSVVRIAFDSRYAHNVTRTGVGKMDNAGEKPNRATSDGCRAHPWAHGNPYSKPFPRARLWKPKDLSGLSGEHQPSGWDMRAEEEAARLAATRNKIPAKEVYAQLVRVVCDTGKARIPKITPPVSPAVKEGNSVVVATLPL